MSYSSWTLVGEHRPGADVRLFCFSYAGGGASAFRDWHRLLPAAIEVVAVQLPGRENRFKEARYTSLAQLMAPLRLMISQLDDKPFYFFGHSLGALVAFELTRTLQRAGLAQPFHLVASGMRAPHVAGRKEQLHLLPDDALLERIANYNGTPSDVLYNRELMRFFLPQMRDDFAIFETYDYIQGTSLRCPLTALGGTDDPNVALEELTAWSMHTKGPFSHRLFEGDHFFINPHRAEVLGILGRITADFLEAGPERPSALRKGSVG